MSGGELVVVQAPNINCVLFKLVFNSIVLNRIEGTVEQLTYINHYSYC